MTGQASRRIPADPGQVSHANGGSLNGERIIGRKTLELMASNHLGPDVKITTTHIPPGHGFGLGFAVLTNPARSPDALSIGSFTWGGANGTLFWIDPQEDLIGILMLQINPYTHFNIRPLFSVAVSQAITDSLADQKPRIMGYDTPR